MLSNIVGYYLIIEHHEVTIADFYEILAEDFHRNIWQILKVGSAKQILSNIAKINKDWKVVETIVCIFL